MRPPIEQEIEDAEVEVADSQQQQTAVMLVSTRLAGNAVIRVVNRCNEAQESNDLGERRAGSAGRGGKKRTERDGVLQDARAYTIGCDVDSARSRRSRVLVDNT
jgi:hypothetical protein